MKIALFYPHNLLACCYACGSYVNTLTRMGHEVLDCSFPGNTPHDLEQITKKLPSIEMINEECDVVLATYLEWIHPWLKTVYGLQDWKRLKVPVIGRFDESFDRSDIGLPGAWEELQKWAHYFFFPAAQDAEKFGGEFLPYGADTTIFSPAHTEKRCDVGFVGSLYPLRRKYLDALAPHLSGLVIRAGNAVVQRHDIYETATLEAESMALLAENYRSIKIFFCFPPLSNLIVEKVVDVMACGTMVMYPRLSGAAAKNMSVFEDEKEIVYYENGYAANNARQIRYYLEQNDVREKIASAGCNRIHTEYTLENMLQKMLAPVLKETHNLSAVQL